MPQVLKLGWNVSKQNPKSLILAPLLVMVLLTFLVGGTAYQQTLNWESGINRIVSNVSRVVILGNIRWGLRKIQNELPTQPDQAKADWNEIHREALVLADLDTKADPENTARPLSPLIQSILHNPTPSPLLINGLLQSDFFFFSLDQIDELNQLQAEARHVTQWVTVSMIILGLLLTGITAYDLERLIQQLARSRDLNIQLQEEERRRIAQDLHDGVVQELIELKRSYHPNKIDAVVHNLRRVCHNLKPQVLEDLGLAAALEFLADDLRQSHLQTVQLNLDEGLGQLPHEYELPLFRVVQELCSNIKRHAQATQAKITLAYNPAEGPVLSGFVSDNGTGFNPAAIRVESMGIAGVRERIEQIGGNLTIQTQPGQGSRFQFIIPVKQHASKKS